MSLAKGIYGIEFDPAGDGGDPDASGLVKVVAVIVLVAVVALSVHLARRARKASSDAGEATTNAAVAADGPAAPSAAAPAPPDPTASEALAGAERRPVKVRNLLLRLDEAERRADVEMSISTIEQIRALPGQPAADLDDRLARRLGELNARWLFELHNAQWVKPVTVRPGDSATRIAREHGSTLASMIRLNGWTDANRLVSGREVLVMNHPRFSLVVHRRTRTADLQLNGKFFRRFDLSGEVTGEPGAYETPERLRTLLAEKGIVLSKEDRAELELLLPKGTPVLISEL